jgi:hypothetical protein
MVVPFASFKGEDPDPELTVFPKLLKFKLEVEGKV